MADNKYFDSKDHRLEFNIAEWVEFLFDKSYAWPEPSGTKSADDKYNANKPYWSFKLKAGGVEYTWQTVKKDLAEALNGILANGDRRVAVMKMSGTGDDKKHYLCLSNPSGSLMTCIPNREIPKHFVDFVGVSSNGEGVAPQPSQPQQQSPAVIPPREMVRMNICLKEAFDEWYDTLQNIALWRDSLPPEKQVIAEMAFLAFQQAMANGLAQTAHTLFLTKNKNGH